MTVLTPAKSSATLHTLRVGSVSFLNAKPLIFGLEQYEDIDLSLEVPSRLLDGLHANRYDVALLPVIDYQRMPGLRLLTSGGIGSNGRTMTVRIFSPVPIEQIATLACDTDSHTSVALARVLLGERYGIRPEFVPLDLADADPTAARLLIGDKVVCEEPSGLDHQLDLGQGWKELTGLPFVFAAWMARASVPLGNLPHELSAAKNRGRLHIEQIIAQFAIPRGWPADVAREYLTERLHFDIGPSQLEAIRLFHRLAYKYGLMSHEPRELDVIHA